MGSNNGNGNMHVWSSEELIQAAAGDAATVDLQAAANRLGICQFDLFRQAYGTWHDDGPNDELVGRYFEAYAVDGSVPWWVRLHAEAAIAEPVRRPFFPVLRAVA